MSIHFLKKVGLISVLFLIMMPYPFLLDHRWIFLSIGALINLIVFSNNFKKISLNFAGWCFFIFIIYSFISGLWASNLSLIWPSFFIWNCLFMWFIIAHLVSVEFGLEFIEKLLKGISVFCFGYVFINEFISIFRLNSLLPIGYNKHYCSILLIGLSPFVLFNKKLLELKYKFCFLFVLLLLFVLNSSSKGALLLLIIISLLGIGLEINLKAQILELFRRKKFLFGLGSFLSIIFIVLLITIISKFGIDKNDLSRVYQYQDSVRILVESNYIGVGLGNWFTHAYSADITNELGTLNNSFYRLIIHSIYGLLLAELGIIGLTLYLLFMLYLIAKLLVKYNKLTYFQKASFYCIVSFLISSSFYLTSFSYAGNFSGFQFISLLCLGALNFNLRNIENSMSNEV